MILPIAVKSGFMSGQNELLTAGSMKEIGGYIELEHNHGRLYHDEAIRLNCGRACLEYLIRAYEIKKIWLPLLLCDSVKQRCDNLGVETEWYYIEKDFSVSVPGKIREDDWLYVVNYYGQMTEKTIHRLNEQHERIIVDNAQAFFELPIKDFPTIYTCRKFFGVSDGAFLYSPKKVDTELETDYSYNRLLFLQGRFEKEASEFYDDYVRNNEFFVKEPMKKMSLLTENTLRGLDYGFIRRARTENWKTLHRHLKKINRLKLRDTEDAFAYPLLVKNGKWIRENLIKMKIYVPLLWPNVLIDCKKDSIEYELADNILPLPCDQRYTREDMDYIAEKVIDLIR